MAEQHESISKKFPCRSHIVFKYTTGQDALSWLQGQLDQDSDRLQDESHCQTVGSIVYQTHAAIKFLHDRDWVHGDVKPENVLICFIDGLVNAKLIDFGAAKRKSDRFPPTSRGTHANFTLDMLLEHFMLGRIVRGSTKWKDVLSAGSTSDCGYFALLLMAYRLSCARDLPLMQPPLYHDNSGALAIVEAFAYSLDTIEKFFQIKCEQQGASSNNWMRRVLLQMREDVHMATEEVRIAARAIADQRAQKCAQPDAPPRRGKKRPSPGRSSVS